MPANPRLAAKHATPPISGMTTPARTVRANPSMSFPPMRCAATIDVPIIEPYTVNARQMNSVLAAVAPASATVPMLPMAIVSTVPSS